MGRPDSRNVDEPKIISVLRCQLPSGSTLGKLQRIEDLIAESSHAGIARFSREGNLNY